MPISLNAGAFTSRRQPLLKRDAADTAASFSHNHALLTHSLQSLKRREQYAPLWIEPYVLNVLG